jgi:parallel beta-helix repeat protein
VLLENNVITESAAIGLTVLGTEAVIRHNTVSKNGLLGIHADGATNALVENNLVSGNNAQRFQAGSNEGGLKFTRSGNVRISGNRSEANLGQGLWLDIDSDYGTIVRNLVRNNSRTGIQVELADDTIVASNVVQGSGGNGVYVLESARASIWNNTLVGNRRNIIAMDGLRSAVLQTVTIRNNVASGGRDDTISLVGVIDANKQRTGSQMGVTMNRNAYYRSSSTQPDLLLVWAAGSTGNLMLRTLADVRAATGQESAGMYAQGASDPFVTAPDAGDYGRPADSAALGAGASLPLSIANAIGGVPSGSPVDIGVLVLG